MTMVSASVVVSFGTRRGANAEINQDAIGVNGWVLHSDSPASFPPWGGRELALQVDEGPLVLVVADGIGGIPESHTASLVVAEAASRPVVAGSPEALREALNAAHERILAIGRDRPAAHGIGSTVVGLMVGNDGTLVRFNVGDSRFYYTSLDSLVLGSRDDREQVAFSTRRRLSAWLGQPEASDGMQPYVQVMTAVGERRVLLCSDGLSESVDELTMQGIVRDPRLGPAGVVQRLLEAAGEFPEDDVTVVVAHVSVRSAQAREVPPLPPEPERWWALGKQRRQRS